MTMMTGSPTAGAREIRAALGESRRQFAAIGLFSAFVNLLMLTGPLFMLQVYDRVLTSRSEATLVALVAIVAFLFLMMGLLDHARGRVLARAGARFQARLDGRVLGAILTRAGPLARVALGAGNGAPRPGGDAALRLGPRALRVLRRAVDAGLPVCTVHLPLAAGPAGRALRRAAAGAGVAEPGAHGTAASGGGSRGGAGGPFRGAGACRRRDGAGPGHARGRDRAHQRAPDRRAEEDHRGLGPQRRLRGDFTHAPPVPPIDDARARCLARDLGRGDTGDHDRGGDPDGPGAGADRPGGGAVAGAAARAGGPPVAGEALARDPGGTPAHAAARAGGAAGGVGPRRRGTRRRDAGGPRGVGPAGAGHGHRHRGAVGRGQVDAGARARRGLAAALGHSDAGRGGTRPIRGSGAGAPCRVAPAGGGAV